jgi:hypothetical protein
MKTTKTIHIELGIEGPFTSPWCDTPHFLVRTLVGDQVVFVVVPDGVQPEDGTRFPQRRDAQAFLRENGFCIANKRTSFDGRVR